VSESNGHGLTEVLRECHRTCERGRSVPGVLKKCYRSVKEVLQECYGIVTGVLKEC
jgi:hypothetical protein